jgi:hypothetical protein
MTERGKRREKTTTRRESAQEKEKTKTTRKEKEDREPEGWESKQRGRNQKEFEGKRFPHPGTTNGAGKQTPRYQMRKLQGDTVTKKSRAGFVPLL